MNLAEMIDSVITEGGDGQQVVEMLIQYGHLPPDANTRPAGKTAEQVKAVELIAAKLTSLDGR
jgi:hypothetical protein